MPTEIELAAALFAAAADGAKPNQELRKKATEQILQDLKDAMENCPKGLNAVSDTDLRGQHRLIFTRPFSGEEAIVFVGNDLKPAIESGDGETDKLEKLIWNPLKKGWSTSLNGVPALVYIAGEIVKALGLELRHLEG